MMHHTGVAFLKIVAKGLLHYFSFGLVPGAVVDGLVDGGEGLCKDIANWGQGGQKQELQKGIQAVGQASAEELRQAVAEIVADVAADIPDQQPQLKSLLTQVQANIRRTLRRPDDPRGTTIPPGLVFDSPQSLLPLIPHKLARFQSGDRPLPGVDLQLVELLGIGGFGEVWQAINPNMPHSPPVALKFCLDATAAKTLRNEAGLLNQVLKHGKHPGIVELRHTYLSADPAALEYEYVAGGELTDLIRNAPSGLTPAEARAIIWELAETMAFAHRSGIVHRDLKPANILVPASTQPGERRFKIADFGIGSLQSGIAGRATRGHTAGQRLAESLIGSHTPLYSSLEQARGDEPHPADDVFSLGVIWYQLLFGDLNEGAPTSRRWPDKLRARGMPDDEIELLADCFEARNDRPQSACELVERLWQVASREVAPQNPAEPPTLLIAPFDTPTARRAQADWARHLGQAVEHTNSLGMKFMLIPPGSFLMGSPEDECSLREADEGPQHRVSITQPIYLGMYEVTQAEYERVMDVNPSYFDRTEEGSNSVESMDTSQFPVEQVSWDEANEFCKKLSSFGEECVAGRRYRLPTEAEWEYACRAGTTTPFHFGDSLSRERANIGGKLFSQDEKEKKHRDILISADNGGKLFSRDEEHPSLARTTTVGSYPPNAFGLFDMHGNVGEWCQDWYDEEYYAQRVEHDPQGPTSGNGRVLRGGSWWYSTMWCSRAAVRDSGDPDHQNYDLGFRVVCAFGVRTS